MRRVIGMDLHRTFAEVMVWEEGRLRQAGRVDKTRSGLEGFSRSLLKTDEVVIEATGNAMVVSHLLTPYVARVVIANRSTPASRSRETRSRSTVASGSRGSPSIQDTSRTVADSVSETRRSRTVVSGSATTTSLSRSTASGWAQL